MTHDKIKALDDLIAAVEKDMAGPVPHHFDDVFGVSPLGNNAIGAYHGSLDASMALHEALLPGWFPCMLQNIHHGHWYAWVQHKATLKHFSAEGDNPARAWLIAILKAYRAKMDVKPNQNS